MENECVSLLISFENFCLNVWLSLNAYVFAYLKLQAINIAVLFSKTWASDNCS